MRIGAIVATVAILLFTLPAVLIAQDSDAAMLRIGMVGLDTSHAPAFTKLFNADDTEGNLARMKVVAAFPMGSQDIASSRDRVEGFTEQLQGMGVEIVDSLEAMVPMVDAVLLESVDGRSHLQQVLPFFKAGKPVFVDKPLGGDLVDSVAIDLLGKKYNARWFSSSSLRFSPSILRYREDPAFNQGIQGVTAWSPCSLDPTHTDLYWYGVHGVEILYTAMGPGCESVTRVHTDGVDVAVGVWDQGRVGTFRGIRAGKADYGLVVFGQDKVVLGGKYEGYAPLVVRIADFFAGGPHPVDNAETLEMMTFMQAADSSREAGGCPVKLQDVREAALKAARKKLAKLDP